MSVGGALVIIVSDLSQFAPNARLFTPCEFIGFKLNLDKNATLMIYSILPYFRQKIFG